MWEEDWARLGIEPTTEQAAIKKAYAARLKVTRPDDDAEAYQALRGAYERAQQWAAWERDRPPEPALETYAPPMPEAPAARDEARTTPTALPRVADAPPEPLEPLEPIEALEPSTVIESLELAWRRGGEHALMQAWPAARVALDAQPLARRGEFSAAFARWLVNLPQLPDRFARALDDHFGWLGDFRTERLIGTALAQELHATLAERFPPPVAPGLRAAAEPLLRVAALREAGRWGLLHLVLLMLHPTLSQLIHGLNAALLRRLGLDLDTQAWLRARVQRGLWMRVGLCVALVAAAAWLKAEDGAVVFSQMQTWLGIAGLVMVVGVFGGSFINKGPGFTVGGRRRELPLAAWRQGRMQPALGLAWLLFASWALDVAGEVRFTPMNSPTLALLPHWVWLIASGGFALAGLFTAWPLVPLHGLVVASLSPLAAYLFVAAFGAWIPPGSAALIGLAWLLGSAAVAVRRMPAPPWVIWLCRPVINALMIAEQWSYSLAMLAPAAALAWLVLHGDETRPLTLFAIWALGQWLTARLQAWLDSAALRRLPPLPPADGSA